MGRPKNVQDRDFSLSKAEETTHLFGGLVSLDGFLGGHLPLQAVQGVIVNLDK